MRHNQHPAGGDDPRGPGALLELALGLWASLGRRTVLQARGYSMWPAIRTGDQITVRHGGAIPEVGQVVVVQTGARSLAHRVISRRPSGGQFEVQTKGDFTLVADPEWSGPDRLVGVVESVARAGRIVRRPGIEGRAAWLMAIVSRWQGRACAPLHRLRLRYWSRQGNGS